MGTYGFFRFSYPLFPEATHWFQPAMAVLAILGIVYGGFVALAQTDFKKMVAYSSVSHMGFVLLGLAALNANGFRGAMLQMFTHGTITGGLFLLVGVLYDRAHSRDLNDFGGLGAKIAAEKREEEEEEEEDGSDFEPSAEVVLLEQSAMFGVFYYYFRECCLIELLNPLIF
jgi:NADH:ubiquinone oxidoreductase subunit 4 (subunit M)